MNLLASISTTVYLIIAAAYFFTIISIIGIVISENRNPVKSLAWITVLLLLPVVGIVLYAFFGRSLKSERMISRGNKRKLMKNRRNYKVNIKELPVSDNAKQLIKLGKSLTGNVSVPCNSIEILTSGKDKFDSLVEDISRAQKYINIEYYIFENDRIGRELSNALIAKAKEGIKVRIIYDHVGSFHVNNSFFKEMRQAGIDVLPFLKVTFPQLATHLNWRNHRKLVIIDGNVGYIGGMNIADRYVYDTADGKRAWRDTHLRVTGAVVAELQNSFAIDWNFMKQPLLNDCPTGENKISPDSKAFQVQFIRSGPMGQWSNVAVMMCHAIAAAKKSVFIQTPYFIPTETLLIALQTAALSKVDVRLMIPRRGDSKLLTLASFSFIKSCLSAGIKVYLYEPGMLHVKTMVVDDDIFTTGSTNFDFRSIECNFECNLFIYDSEITQQAKDIFMLDLENCTRVVSSTWRHRPITQRALESLVRLFSPIL